MRRAAKIKQGENIIGNRVKAKIVKNKVAPPFQACEFDIMYNEGISITGDLLDLGVQIGHVKKSGTYYTYKEHKLGPGREKAKQMMKEDASIMSMLRDQLWNEIKGAASSQAQND